jgi:hypothetical protein
LTFDPQGRLLLTTDEGMLVNVHMDGSGAEAIGSLPYTDIYGLGMTQGGEIFGIRGTNQLVTIDASTGRASAGASLSADFLIGRAWGATFPVHHVPEPATLAVFTLALATCCSWRSLKPPVRRERPRVGEEPRL